VNGADPILNAGIDTGPSADTLAAMGELPKITVEVPAELLERAQAAADAGVTETVRRGLALVAAGRAYEGLRQLRGKLRLRLDLETLREDR
jgi:hypothetical protein